MESRGIDMRQVIVRIRDCKLTYTKTIDKYYFYCVSSYKYDVMDCIKNLLPGQEICVKIGTLYSKYISYEDVLNYQKENLNDNFDECLSQMLLEDDFLNYYLEAYLPQY